MYSLTDATAVRKTDDVQMGKELYEEWKSTFVDAIATLCFKDE